MQIGTTNNSEHISLLFRLIHFIPASRNWSISLQMIQPANPYLKLHHLHLIGGLLSNVGYKVLLFQFSWTSLFHHEYERLNPFICIYGSMIECINRFQTNSIEYQLISTVSIRWLYETPQIFLVPFFVV